VPVRRPLVNSLRVPHRAELRRQVDLPRPVLEHRLDAVVERRVLRQHLQPRPGADAVVRERLHHPAQVAVVGHLVACAVADGPPHVERVGGGGTECIGVRPVASVLVGRLSGIVAGAENRQVRRDNRHCHSDGL